jgi:oxygen-independent coproporphyrinogen-3 oxidase
VDHISAYSLIVEDGTAMARKVRKGQLPTPDEDVYADRYEMIDAALQDAGLGWYEVSNWSRPGGECRHNLVYWRGGQWWGAGPGAHGCVRLHGRNGITRLVNAKLPRRYAEALASGNSPVVKTEPLSDADVHTERIMTGLRLAEGLPDEMVAHAPQAVARHVGFGLLEQVDGRTRLTGAGRLLADGIITDILVEEDD